MNRCIYCMKEIEESAGTCPHCGKAQSGDFPMHFLPAGTLLKDKYLVGASIGAGGFGITYVGWDTELDYKVAIKEYFPVGVASRNNTVSNEVSFNIVSATKTRESLIERFKREAVKMKKCHDEPLEVSIVDVKERFEYNNTAYIVMEFLEGETLKDYLVRTGTMKPEDVVSLLSPMMRALARVHREKLIHRDIAADNIMITKDGRVVLFDFGAARDVSDDAQRSMSVELKRGYAPPEQYEADEILGPTADIYALCATMYYCITGDLPQESTKRIRSKEEILVKPSTFGIPIPKAIEAAIMKGLELDPEDRFQTVEELMQALGNAGIGFDEAKENPAARTSMGINAGNINRPDFLDNKPQETKKEESQGFVIPDVVNINEVGQGRNEDTYRSVNAEIGGTVDMDSYLASQEPEPTYAPVPEIPVSRPVNAEVGGTVDMDSYLASQEPEPTYAPEPEIPAGPVGINVPMGPVGMKLPGGKPPKAPKPPKPPKEKKVKPPKEPKAPKPPKEKKVKAPKAEKQAADQYDQNSYGGSMYDDYQIPKKKGVPTPVVIGAAGVVLLLAIVLIIVLVLSGNGGNDDSDDDDSVAVTVDKNKDKNKDTDTNSDDIEDVVVLPKVSTFEDFDFTIGNFTYEVPTSIKSFETDGWVVGSGLQYTSQIDPLVPTQIEFSNGTAKIKALVINTSASPKALDELLSYSVSSSKDSTELFTVAGGVNVNSSEADIIAVYGTPNESNVSYLAYDVLMNTHRQVKFTGSGTGYYDITLTNLSVSYEADALSTYHQPITLAGDSFTLPCKLSDFTSAGWEIKPGPNAYDITENTMIDGVGSHEFYVKKGDASVTLTVYNTDYNAKKLSECQIGKITAYKDAISDVTVAGRLGFSSSKDEIISVLGTPYSASETQSNTEVIYQLNRYNSLCPYSELSFSLLSNGNSKIEITNLDYADEYKTLGSDSAPACLNNYVSPASYDEDFLSGVFSLNGKVYQFPVPLKNLIADGWTVVQQPGVIPAGATMDVTIQNDVIKLVVKVTNLDVNMHNFNNCSVTGVVVTNGKTDIKLPSNITPASDQAALNNLSASTGVSNLDSVNSTEYMYDKIVDGKNVKFAATYDKQKSKITRIEYSIK